ncbi:hypothetical protein Cantr_06090 [Candida viswanathii]|uniref:Inner kinetochore subunit AME1 domain-containing protein n=1 Tax=Candida viswanathii TaxID=5486 RepID=A0A367XUT7_9ASCO|nr:hypothetical protein Cantr_06090 [Candida viswanathii]
MDSRSLKKNARIRGSGARNVQPSELNINNNKPRIPNTNNRINKKDARIRGSGARNTKTGQSLTISSSSAEKKRLVSQLSSVLIHKEDLELTRSTRRKSSILPYTIIDELPPARRPKKRVSFKEQAPPEPEPEMPDINDVETPGLAFSSPQENSLITAPKKSVGRPKKQKSHRGRKPKAQQAEEESTSDTSFLKAEEIDAKIAKVRQRIQESSLIGNGGSRRRLTNSSFLDSPRSGNSEAGLIGGPARKAKRTKKRKKDGESSLISEPPVKRTQPAVIPTPSPEPESVDSEEYEEVRRDEDDRDDPDYGSSAMPGRRHLPPSTRDRRIALPLLSQTKSRISIDYPTLVNASNSRGRVQRARLLDVLRSLISTFEPPPSVPTKNLPIHETFKDNLLAGVDKLRDAATTVEDIAKNINSVQRAKKELRQMILDLRKDHTDIGNQLNQLRVDMKDKKEEAESLSLLTDQLKLAKESVHGGESATISQGLDNKVQLQLFSLGKVLNPTTGLYPKLQRINNKLEHLDNDL